MFTNWHVFEVWIIFQPKCSVWTIFYDKVCSSANLQITWTQVFWKLRKYLSTCNVSISNLQWQVKQPHYCLCLVRSRRPNCLCLVRFHPPYFKQPKQHMTPVNLDKTLYVPIAFNFHKFISYVLLVITLSAFKNLCFPGWSPFIFDKPFWNELNDIVVCDCLTRMREWVLYSESRLGVLTCPYIYVFLCSIDKTVDGSK